MNTKQPTMKSKTALTADLMDLGLSARIDTESFGRETFAYVVFASFEERVRAQTLLLAKGHRINMGYGNAGRVAEIRIGYLKGAKRA